MSKNTSNNQKNTPNWLLLEQEVAKLFKLFGYDEVTHNTKIEGGQCDVVAKSRKRNKANILAECKYHSNPSSKVNITEVQNFIFKVSNYRNSGKIDQGYLVTNTGFTADARGAINENTSNYVFLLTYDELIQSLLDIDYYLQDFISVYDNNEEGSKYVELKLINTTTINQTLLDSLPGDLIKDKEKNISYLVVPSQCINDHQHLPFLDFENDLFIPSIKPIVFFKELRDIQIKKREASSKYITQLVEVLSMAINEVATDIEDGLLDGLFIGLQKDVLSNLNWSCEAVIDTLIDKWEEFGGSYYIKTYNKSNFKRHIKRNIINKYREKASLVSLDEIRVPMLLSTFSGHIIEALNIKPGHVNRTITTPKKGWTSIDEFENIIKHLETKNVSEYPQLQLLPEEEAIFALNNFIVSDSTNTLVLIGDYGAGKTTILRRLMRRLSDEKLSKKDDPNYRIPLFISLKDYNKVPDIYSLIRLFLQNTVEVDNISVRTFKKLNADGRFVLLLDAFDEMLTRVTTADRRRCFKEISELVSENSKIILTGRPAYFNDYKEFKENLEVLRIELGSRKTRFISDYEIKCLQLLDEDQVEKLIKKSSPHDYQNLLLILTSKPNLMDLARRPVLVSMIADTGEELIKLGNQDITARNIYEIYTNKWVQREEDKGEFRLLVHPEQKSTFLRYLAMQMFLSGSMIIHYSELDVYVEKYFNLDTIVEVDHFSHDIRTCSFLSRTDDGYYYYIHKSFMEYFVACEFEKMEKSPFANNFSGELTNEIIEFLDFSQLPSRILLLWSKREKLENFKTFIKKEKDAYVLSRKYEFAARMRDVEKEIGEALYNFNSIFTMKPTAENIFTKFERKIKNPSLYDNYIYPKIKDHIKDHIKDLFDT